MVEVFAVDFGDHEFNFECLAELFRLAQLKNYFFQVVVGGQYSYHKVKVLGYILVHGLDECFRVVLQTRLHSWHLERTACQILILNHFLKTLSQTSLARAGDAADQDHRNRAPSGSLKFSRHLGKSIFQD